MYICIKNTSRRRLKYHHLVRQHSASKSQTSCNTLTFRENYIVSCVFTHTSPVNDAPLHNACWVITHVWIYQNPCICITGVSIHRTGYVLLYKKRVLIFNDISSLRFVLYCGKKDMILPERRVRSALPFIQYCM